MELEIQNKFKNGKIYKVVDVNNNKSYYGSTIQRLSMRMALHRKSYKDYKNAKFNKLCVFDIFDEFGVENCKIELIKVFPCNDKISLLKEEGQYIRNNDCVNRIIAGRTIKEYYEDNREKYSEHSRKYYTANKAKISDSRKLYYIKNRDKLKEKQKAYYHSHKPKPEENILIEV